MRTTIVRGALAVLAVLGLLAGCGTGGTSGGSPSSDGPRLVFSFGQSVHPFFVAMEKGARDAAEQHGAKLTTTSADYVLENQIKNVEDSLQRRPSALLLNPIDSKALASSVRLALNEGVPVITVDIDVVGATPTSFVSSDNREIGRMAAEYLIKRLAGHGKVALIGAPQVTSTMQREEGFLQALKAAPGIELVANSGEAMERSSALDAAETILQANPGLNAVFGVNESGALGALGAVQARGLNDQVSILAVDATPDVLTAIKGNTAVKATIAQDPYQMGFRAVEGALAAINKQTPDAQVSVPIDLVTSENVQKFIDREAQYAR